MLPTSDRCFYMHGALHGDCDMHALWQMSAFARSQKRKKKAADMQVGSERLSPAARRWRTRLYWGP